MTGARTLYRDLTLIDGTGAAPVADAAVLVEDGVIGYAGPAADAPDGDDLDARSGDGHNHAAGKEGTFNRQGACTNS